MRPEEYGEKYPDHLLEQYKLYVEMADRISQRREHTNRFYVTLLAALAALLVVLVRFTLLGDDGYTTLLNVVILCSGVFGAFLSWVWCLNIQSYRALNSAKFVIIHKLEKQLPFNMYKEEWNLIEKPGHSPKYIQLTAIEQYVPIIVLGVFLLLIGYSLFMLVRC